MSRRGTSAPRPSPSHGRRTLMPLIAAIGIGALLLTMIAAIIPALIGGTDDPTQGEFDPFMDVTPGGEEAEMRARLEEDPNDVAAMIILADLLTNTGRGREAVPLFEEAIEHRPNDAALRIAFGRSLGRLGFPLDAELQLMRAREIAPDNPEPLFVLGQVYESSNPPRIDEARQMYEQILEEAPDSIYADRAREQLNQLDQGQ